MDVEEGKLEEELVDKPGTMIRTKFSVLHCVQMPLLMRCGFLTVDPFMRASVFVASFPADKIAGILEEFHCGLFMPLAVMTVVGLHDFVKVSISAEFKSFLLIMCIDAPESTTNFHSSGFES